MAGVHTQQLAACDSCFLLKPVEEYARPDGRWETACLACRSSGRAAKRPRTADEREPAPQLAEADMENDEEETFNSQVDALMGLELFRAALKSAPPNSARKLMTQLVEGRELGRINAEMAADVALAYLAQHVPQAGPRDGNQQGQAGAGAARQQQAPPAQQLPQPQRLVPPPPPRLLQQMAQQAGQQQQQQQQRQQLLQPGQQHPGQQHLMQAGQHAQQQLSPPPAQQAQQAQQEVPPAMAAALRAKQQAAMDAVPTQMLRLILEAAPQRCRARLFAMSRRCAPLLGQLLCSADPASLLAEGHLSSEELLAALQQQPGQAALPAAAAVAAAAALLASAPPGPSPPMLHLVKILAEGHRLMALVEAGHLAPAQLRGALAGAPAEAFTEIFKAMCTSDPAGQSFIKQAMQRAMPRADYGELMRISMLAEVARTAATVTDRTTLLSLLEKAFG